MLDRGIYSQEQISQLDSQTSTELNYATEHVISVLDANTKSPELMKQYRAAINKNKKLVAIGKEVKTFISKYSLP